MKKTNTKQQHAAQVILDYGKVPPQAVDLEEAVLGAIMIEKDAIVKAIEFIKPESFYKDNHQKIYQVMFDLYNNNERVIDIYTVTEELKNRGLLEEAGGPMYIAQLTSKIATAAHVEFHARIVAQKYIQRELIRISSEIQSQAFDNTIDVDDLLDFSERELFKVAEGNLKRDAEPLNKIVKETIKEIEEAAKNESVLSGLPSGFTKIDRVTGGWQKADLIIIAARPSMGKTAFALSMMRNMSVDHKKPVAVFSLEMSSKQLVNRLIVSETGIPLQKLRNGKLMEHEWEQLSQKLKAFDDAPIFIDDSPAISVFEFRAKCRRLKIEHDVSMIIIDYLQLMTTGTSDSKGTREQEVSSISRSLKAIAKELDVPIIAISQLNRSVETRSGNKRPQLSDLRESGAIEQDADLVIFIHRPEKYQIMEDDEGISTIGMAEVIIAKHRNGALEDIKLRFVDSLAKFTEYDDSSAFEYVESEIGTVKAQTFQSKMSSKKIDNSDIKQNTGFGNENKSPF